MAPSMRCTWLPMSRVISTPAPGSAKSRIDARRSAARCRRQSWRRPGRAVRRRGDRALDAHDLVAERVDDGVRRLAHALVGGGEGRFHRAGMAVDVADDASAGRGERRVDGADLVVDLHDELLAGRVEALLRHLDGRVDERDLRGHRCAHFRAGLPEPLVGREERAVDRRKLAVEVGDEPVAARAEPLVAGFDGARRSARSAWRRCAPRRRRYRRSARRPRQARLPRPRSGCAACPRRSGRSPPAGHWPRRGSISASLICRSREFDDRAAGSVEPVAGGDEGALRLLQLRAHGAGDRLARSGRDAR